LKRKRTKSNDVPSDEIIACDQSKLVAVDQRGEKRARNTILAVGQQVCRFNNISQTGIRTEYQDAGPSRTSVSADLNIAHGVLSE
jgi:hypothetical protein